MKRWLGNISLWSTTTWELTGVASLGLGSRLRTDETEMSPPCKTQPSPVSICFKVLFQDAKLNLSFIHPSFHEQYYVHQIDAHQNFLKASSVHLDSWKLQGELYHICHTWAGSRHGSIWCPWLVGAIGEGRGRCWWTNGCGASDFPLNFWRNWNSSNLPKTKKSS